MPIPECKPVIVESEKGTERLISIIGPYATEHEAEVAKAELEKHLGEIHYYRIGRLFASHKE